MESTARPRVKVCCIASAEEARTAVRFGASALGLVSDMPSGPGVIEEALIGRIARAVPPGVASFLLTCSQDASAIAAQQRRAATSAVQLCDRLLTGTYAELRAAMPGIRLVQVVHVTGPEALAEALAVAPEVDALLLDSGRPSLAMKELGGTGRVHDWEISRRIREQVPIPVYLAGGVTPQNAGEAVRQVAPFGLDVCSGVRSEGRLTEDLLGSFFAAIAGA